MTPAHTLTAPRATRTRRSRRAALALIGALCATGVAVPAGAIGDTDGLWYVEAAGLDEIHQRTTGEGITVAVIDNRINPDIPEFEGADLRVPEDSFCQISRNNTTIEPSVDKSESADHGTNVTAMVVGNGRGIDGAPGVRGVAPGATMYFYAGGVTINGEAYPCTVNDTDGIVLAIEQAVADGADIISLSTATNMVQGLPDALARAQRSGIVVLAGSPGVRGINTFETGLAGANGVVVIEAAGPDGAPVPGVSVSNRLVAVSAPGAQIRIVNGHDDWNSYRLQDGTSLATPWVAGALALVWSEHPEATGNQMIHTLLRHTFQNHGDLTRHDDHIGYGTVSILNMLEADPTAYPDTNPLLRDEEYVRPTIEQITGQAPTPTQDAPSEDPATAGDGPDDGLAGPGTAVTGGISTTLLVVAGLLLIGVPVIAAVVAIVIVARRRNQGGQG